MTREEIGLFVLNERKKQNISQTELARRSGISRYQQIIEIEKAQFDYSFTMLNKVIRGLGFKLSFSTNGHVSPVQPESNATASFVIMDFSKVESAKEPEPLKNKTITTQFKRKNNNHVKNHK